MIRLFIFILALALIWLLFFTKLDIKRKSIAVTSVIIIFIVSLVFEMGNKTPRTGIISLDQVSTCGVSAEFTYRTNYNIEFCIQNKSPESTVERVELEFSVSRCDQICSVIQSQRKEITANLAGNSKAMFVENLRFDLVEKGEPNLFWEVSIKQVYATK